MALSSVVMPSLSSPSPRTVAMLNRSGSPSSTSSSASSSCGLTGSTPLAVAFMPSVRWTSLSSSRRSSQIVRMAPEEEKMTRRSPLDFPIEWERPKPGRRPDIFPQFSPMKTPLPPPLPADPPEEDEEEEEKKEEEEDPEKEDPDKPDE